MSSRQEDWHPNRKSQTQQKNPPQKEDSLRNFFPTGRMTNKQLIKNPTGRLAPQRRLIMRMLSQLKDWHPNSKSKSVREDLPQREDSLRKYLPGRKTDTQTGNQKPNRKICPRKCLPNRRTDPKEEITNPTESLDPERRLEGRSVHSNNCISILRICKGLYPMWASRCIFEFWVWWGWRHLGIWEFLSYHPNHWVMFHSLTQ